MPAEEFSDAVAACMMDRLKSDSVLQTYVSSRVYDTNIPQAETDAELEALYPCVVFSLDSAGQILAGGGETIVWSPDDYQVIAIGFGEDFTALNPIAARIRQRLHGFRGTVTGGGYINWCRYRKLVKGSQVPDNSGRRFVRQGGIYRIASKLSA